MNKKQELLIITMEECGELIQACSKLIRFEKDECPNDISNLQDEIGDLMCMIELLKRDGLVTEEQIKDRMFLKEQKLMKWSSLFNED
jgi:NTP pyrophosphatase (non-canonical NTP hydrolase)|tara:strand:+ start:2252 stop:2512 length:261 start_codon:yes stop_codon:yes gene_type:complete